MKNIITEITEQLMQGNLTKEEADKTLLDLHVVNCFAVIDDEENIVQLYQTEEKANKGLWEFQNSHPHTEFTVDTVQVN
jgi:hypothetical protein|tara:strand:- start:4773 stop:5009 length:237 start_codon:yes stop_codon:yes gene_type:complete